MGLFSRKPKSSDWKITGNLPDGRAVAVDSNGNTRTYAPGGEIVTYDKKGTVISRTIGNQPGGAGSSDDHSPSMPTSSPPPKIDQIKTDGQQQTPSQISYSPSSAVSGFTSSQSGAGAPSKPEPQKPKVEFRTADNGDLLQRAEGGNWYVAKDNPDPANVVTSPSEGMNKRYGLGEYASPTPNDALAYRSEALNKENKLGEYTDDPAPIEKTGADARSIALNEQYGLGESERSPAASGAPAVDAGLASRSEALNRQYGLGDYASEPAPAEQAGADARSIALNEQHKLGELADVPTAPAWHTNPNWKTADAGSATAAGLDASQVLEQRPGNNGNTIFRMSDGTYKAYNPETGLHSAGTWDNSQWSSSQYATAGHGGPVNGVDTTIAPGYTATETSAPEPGPTAQELVSGFDYGSASSQPQPKSVPESAAPTSSYSPADQYSGHVDMAEIERSIAEYSHSQPDPITLPGVADNDPTGVAGLDSSSGGDYLNPGRVAGRGRHYAE